MLKTLRVREKLPAFVHEIKKRFRRGRAAHNSGRRTGMGATPSTIFIVIMFPLIFAVCVLWATHGHASNADNEDLSVVAKDH